MCMFYKGLKTKIEKKNFFLFFSALIRFTSACQHNRVVVRPRIVGGATGVVAEHPPPDRPGERAPGEAQSTLNNGAMWWVMYRFFDMRVWKCAVTGGPCHWRGVRVGVDGTLETSCGPLICNHLMHLLRNSRWVCIRHKQTDTLESYIDCQYS